jgi:hypothetical protein
MYLSESEWTPAQDVASVMIWELSWWLHNHAGISWTHFAEAMTSLALILENEGANWHAAALRLTLTRLTEMDNITNVFLKVNPQ